MLLCGRSNSRWLQLRLLTASQAVHFCCLPSLGLNVGAHDDSAGLFVLLTNVSNTMQVALDGQALMQPRPSFDVDDPALVVMLLIARTSAIN